MLGSDQPKLQADCIILAAGLSSRMGSWKLTLPYQGKILLDSALGYALTVCSRVILVVGYRGEVLQKRYCKMPSIQIVHNPDYRQGLLSSIQAGLAFLKHGHFFISHGDMPYLYPRFYRALWFYRRHDVVFLGDKHMSGHPVLLSKKVVPFLQQALPDSSARQVLAGVADTYYLGFPDSEIHRDIDTSQDYAKLLLEA